MSELDTAIKLLHGVVRGYYRMDDSTEDAIEAFLAKMQEPIVTIETDDDCESPRCWDNVGIMYCRHRRYSLGDENVEDPIEEVEGFVVDERFLTVEQAEQVLSFFEDMVPDSEEEEDARDAVLAALDNHACHGMVCYQVSRKDVAICLPIGMHDHSGITLFHGAPTGWDSGQVGWHYMTREALEREFHGDIEKAKECMEAEMHNYDNFVRGNCWAFSLSTRAGNPLDSCGGFIGDTLDATGILDHLDENLHEAARDSWERRFEQP